MKKNNILISKEIMLEAHARTREFVELYKVDYSIQLGLFISNLLEEEKLNREIDFNQYYNDMLANPNYYNYILYNNNIITKNQRLSNDIDKDRKTGANYQILHAEIDDLKNDAIIKLIEYFNKHKIIKYGHRGTLYGQIIANLLRGYARHKARFNMYNSMDTISLDISYQGENEGFVISQLDSISYMDMDLKRLLKDREYKVYALLKDGYQKVEIRDILKVSRPTIDKDIKTIKQVMIDNKLVNL